MYPFCIRQCQVDLRRKSNESGGADITINGDCCAYCRIICYDEVRLTVAIQISCSHVLSVVQSNDIQFRRKGDEPVRTGISTYSHCAEASCGDIRLTIAIEIA